MLQAQQVRYQVGEKALVRGVSLSLAEGEVFALLGPNGAGKSTLLRLLAGDIPPHAGQILLEGQPLSSYSPRQLALKRAVMSQRAEVAFDFTVAEVVRMGRYPHASPHEVDERVIAEALRQTETDHLHERRYMTLSGGEAARVTLARVLAQTTPIILLDEPAAALDLRHQQLLMSVLRERAGEGAAALAILHDLNLAAAYADRIGLMLDGELVAVGSPAEVLTEEALGRVFDVPVRVMTHPVLGCPLVLPLPMLVTA